MSNINKTVEKDDKSSWRIRSYEKFFTGYVMYRSQEWKKYIIK